MIHSLKGDYIVNYIKADLASNIFFMLQHHLYSGIIQDQQLLPGLRCQLREETIIVNPDISALLDCVHKRLTQVNPCCSDVLQSYNI